MENNEWQKEFLKLAKETQDAETKRLEQKIERRIEELKIAQDRNYADLSDRIETSKSSMQNNLDEVDKAFRGNSKIGVFEQLRNIKRSLRILFAIMLLLLGLKVFGSNIQEWWGNFLVEWGLKPREQQTSLYIDRYRPKIISDYTRNSPNKKLM